MPSRKKRSLGPQGLAGAMAFLCALALAASVAAAQTGADCALPRRSALVVDVKQTGARGDARTDDTAAIQRAIDKVGGTGGTVRVPRGVYMVDGVGKSRLNLRSDMTLELARDAILRVIPNAAEEYSLLWAAGISNVTISGGTLEGDRDQHGGSNGEWGMGLRLGGGASNILLSGVVLKSMWGDGIYISGATNVRLCSITAERNRRQGLSVVAVDGLLVSRSVFRNTGGTRPGAGIDMEPNAASERIANVRILNSKFIANAGGGILVAGKRGEVANVEISGNVFEGTEAIDIEYAPGVKGTGICRNRHITYDAEPTGGLSTQAEPQKRLIVQTECGDRRFYSRKKKKS